MLASLKKQKLELLLLLSILILAAFIRFYRLAEMAPFDFDQEYAANFAYSIVHDHKKLLIGQELSIPGLYIGPWYFYYLTPFFALTNLHPIGGAIGSVIISLLIILTYFLVAKQLFGTKAALIVVFLRSLIRINQDLSMVPSYTSEGLVLLAWYIFYKYWHGETKLFPLLGLTFGLYTSIHPILFPLYLVFLILLLIKRKLPKLKTTLLSILAFIIPILPLILFEYWHSFWELKNLSYLFTSSSSETKGFYQIGIYAKYLISRPANILDLNFLPANIVFIIILGLLGWLVYKKIGFWQDYFHIVMLVITCLVFFIYYSIYPAHVPEYYFKAVTTLFVLYIPASLSLLTKYRLTMIFFIIIMTNITVFNLKSIYTSWNNPSLTTLYHKDFIVKEIVKREPKDRNFIVTYITNPGWNFGFDYLFKLYGKEPEKHEPRQRIYTIVTPKSLSPDSINISSGNIGLILPK